MLLSESDGLHCLFLGTFFVALDLRFTASSRWWQGFDLDGSRHSLLLCVHVWEYLYIYICGGCRCLYINHISYVYIYIYMSLHYIHLYPSWVTSCLILEWLNLHEWHVNRQWDDSGLTYILLGGHLYGWNLCLLSSNWFLEWPTFDAENQFWDQGCWRRLH